MNNRDKKSKKSRNEKLERTAVAEAEKPIKEKTKKEKTKSIKRKSKITAPSTCELVNLADVKGRTLYTKDGYIFSYVKVQPISTALMTESEKEFLMKKMTTALSPLNIPFKILFLTRPTDIKQVIDYYEGIKSVTVDTLRRSALTSTINYLSGMAISGGVLERQTYFAIWTKESYEDSAEYLSTKLEELLNALKDSGIKSHICDERDILQMLSLFYNPDYSKKYIDTTPNVVLM